MWINGKTHHIFGEEDISYTKFNNKVNKIPLKLFSWFLGTKIQSKVHLGKIGKNIQEISGKNRKINKKVPVLINRKI